MLHLADRLNNCLYAEDVDLYSKDFQDIFTGKSILITGASGLIGLPLVDLLMHLDDIQVLAYAEMLHMQNVFLLLIKRNSVFICCLGMWTLLIFPLIILITLSMRLALLILIQLL